MVLKIGSGSLKMGYAAAVQIGAEGMTPQAETQARLSPAPDLPGLYRQWQQSYWKLGSAYRIKAHEGVTNVSMGSDVEHCRMLSRQLRDRVHNWLNEEAFRPIREKLLEQLSPPDRVRILLQTQDLLLQRLPWYELQFFDRYRHAEVGICSPDYQQVSYEGTRSSPVRILAVFGNGVGLDTQTDQQLLKSLNAEIHVLEEPSRETFNRHLWDNRGWDILFFAGHSRSDVSGPEGSGELFLNATDKLTIPQLKHALKKAIDRGLNTAIFNSCDGLGLAADLSDLHIPQVLVMREPVPDRVAHAFLQGFLESFAEGSSFYLAVREAREKLQGLEADYPCATWLPVIVQNMAETPPTWSSLQGKEEVVARHIEQRSRVSLHSHWARLRAGVGCSVAIATALILSRQIGLLERWELAAYDQLLRLRPAEAVDSRMLIITNTKADITQQTDIVGNSSLSEKTLSNLLDKLRVLAPEVVGLDIYRPQRAVDKNLQAQLRTTNNLVGICKIPDEKVDPEGILPSPEIAAADRRRVAANDFVESEDNVLRRQLVYLEPVPGFACPGDTFATVVASRYLEAAGNVAVTQDEKGRLYLGKSLFYTIGGSQRSFGGFHDLNVGGTQTLLNYRIAQEATGCGEFKETPADCITVSDFLNADISTLKESVAGRIVLIGTTDPAYRGEDSWLTPYTQARSVMKQVPGVFLQAQMVSAMVSAGLDGRRFLTSWAEWQEMVWIASWAIAGGLVGAYSHSRWSYRLWLRLLMAEGLLLLVCWLWLVDLGVWAPWVPGAIALPTAALATQATLKVTERRDSVA
ncbi:MAG: sensor protein Chase2 [Leptolyngbya foveolarum]|uniref:Sensor protein Chase2 n=1 Tax=Leptolyngbya foveolarum TaxID=47253 RepID=A0A2W4VQC1_9CYAN|nr:MAG: sensor protein Chase2 [Leptolyngbya foveolarum]